MILEFIKQSYYTLLTDMHWLVGGRVENSVTAVR